MTDKTIGTAFKVARILAGLKQQDLAAALGVAPAFLSAVECGHKTFPRHRYHELPSSIRSALIDAQIAELEALR